MYHCTNVAVVVLDFVCFFLYNKNQSRPTTKFTALGKKLLFRLMQLVPGCTTTIVVVCTLHTLWSVFVI